MKSKVYVETTVISYLAASPSRDIVVAGHQETTRAWWSRRDRFELFVSQAVVEGASRGNAVAAARRMECLAGIPMLGLNADIDAIANQPGVTRSRSTRFLNGFGQPCSAFRTCA